MKREYESPELYVEIFTISSSVCTANNGQYDESGAGWEEEEEEWWL